MLKNAYQDLKNLYFLYRANKDLSLVKVEYSIFIDRALNIMREESKRGILRNLTSSLIRKMRVEKPYQVKDYSEIKKLYDDYYKSPYAIQSIKELQDVLSVERVVYITKFSTSAPRKGKGYSEYLVNTYGSEVGVFKITKYNDAHRSFQLKGSRVDYLDECNITCYRYSTDEEIKSQYIYEQERLFWETKIESSKVEQDYYKERLSEVEVKIKI